MCNANTDVNTQTCTKWKATQSTERTSSVRCRQVISNLVKTSTDTNTVYCCAEYFSTGSFPLVTSETHTQVNIPKSYSVILQTLNFIQFQKILNKVKGLARMKTAAWKCQQLCCEVFLSLSVFPLPLWRHVRVKVQTAAAANVAECQAPNHPINHFLSLAAGRKKKLIGFF